jgi:myo-inositol 2-dehydrogenase/D-chiro-inositol 1-dehydrogenase
MGDDGGPAVWQAGDRHGIRQAIPADWRERFIEAYDQEFREWIVAAGNGGATGPSNWDG